MRVNILGVGIFVLACHVAIAAPVKKLFEVTLDDVDGSVRALCVAFHGKLPPPNIVDRILRESLDHAILIDPNVEILATAFLGDEVLNENQHSGSLVYKASEKKVMTFDEYSGVKRTTFKRSGYFVEVDENKTAIKPETKWLSVTIVFPKEPRRGDAYDAIYSETQKLAAKGLDIHACVTVGDEKVKTSWQQMRDRHGAYVFAEYDAANKKITRMGKLLRQLP